MRLQVWGLGLAALAAFTACPAHIEARAESLQEALSAAYKFNPRLDAARATLRATDEEVPRALSGFRPTVVGNADTGYQMQTTRPSQPGKAESNPRGYSVDLQQPIFKGFRVVNTVREAEATVRAGRETLRTTESSVLLEGVTAYVDVVRDQAIGCARTTHRADARPRPPRIANVGG
jgi:outer membrane protein